MGMEGFAARLRKAHRAYEDRLGHDVTQTEIGALVGEELLRMGVKPRSKEDVVTQQSVARWFAGTLPEHVRMVALATVLGVDPGWLSYGSGSDEGQQGAKTNGPTRPRIPVEVANIEDYAVDVPMPPVRKKRVGKKPGDRSARAG